MIFQLSSLLLINFVVNITMMITIQARRARTPRMRTVYFYFVLISSL